MALLDPLRRLGPDRRGAALVEMTLLVPVLIAMMCGLAEFGQALRQYHVMEKGVRDAGRFLARSHGDPCTPGDAYWSGDVTTAQSLAVTGDQSSSTPLLPNWSDKTTVQVTVNCIDNTAGTWHGSNNIPVVKVTASAPYVDMGLLDILGLSAPTLTVFHQELKVY